ncbi:efflux RND transporter periplasmic adaptor subunit [Vibrio porteresiae]|uniref:Efflux RND transporter periplasmic adaptor subunit n=1 Tax=Vibrio porteresiae DSM 19223 TaxID=1123496 RepID=A0ABZ0Q7T4_9VIBR|nr:efflux RND transporter periplasmic adaptor subunit [Vibrio porteresiae]WPC72469.1 efflux RND transporter periplasmic adaptor subunit [Vibrio porteresiae DSM 19223]
MPKMFKPKNLVIAAIALALAGGATYYFYPKEEAPQYATQPVTRHSIEDTVVATGILQASKLVEVGAQVSGQIQKLAVNLGDDIKKGQLVAQIDSLTQQNSLKEAEASLTSLKAQLRAKEAQIRQAQAEFNRQKAMLKDNASSRSDYETAEANLAVYQAEAEELKAEIDQAVISVDTAKVDLGYTTISAPIDGTVVYTAVSEGQTVNSNQSTPTIIELAQLNKMTVKAQISEADVVNVKPGMEVYFTILGKPNKRFHATLRAIEPGPTLMDGDDQDLTVEDDEAIYYYGLFDIDNPDRVLRIGMTAQVSIVLKKSEEALLVPAQVLVKQPGPKGESQYQVPVLENGKVVNRDVKVGINNKVNAEILSGLKEGDQVVLGVPSGDTFTNRMRGPRMF